MLALRIFFVRLARLAVAGIAGVGSILACDCVPTPVPKAVLTSAAVFTGRVVEKRELLRSLDGRRRYEVHFSVAKVWKGSRSPEFLVYDAEPRGDCEGFGFEAGKEYVVFARARTVSADVTLKIAGQDIDFPDIWNDVLPVGTKILIGEICTRTDEITSAGAIQTIRLLGRALRSP